MLIIEKSSVTKDRIIFQMWHKMINVKRKKNIKMVIKAK